jgi:hypothetical protein
MKAKILTFLAITCLVVGLATGCKSVSDTTGKTLAGVEQTVDLAMKGYATWDAQGHVTEAQEQQVRQVYGQYQLAYTAACNAWVAAQSSGDTSTLATIVASLSAAAAPLTTLITQIEGGN